MDEQQLHKVRFGTSFIAPLDQSGGSTPNGKPGNHTHRPVVRPGHTASDSWSEDLIDHSRLGGGTPDGYGIQGPTAHAARVLHQEVPQSRAVAECDQSVISRGTTSAAITETPSATGFRRTPGGTRTPNLLIRSQTLYPN